jgi:zinc D-Ala-D-Ala carboxypeptidase
MTRLTDHFTLSELTHSDVAVRLLIDNDPSELIVAHLKEMCTELLEPMRTFLGGLPVQVSSGYRSKRLNAAIGGSARSQHCVGAAIDFTVSGLSPRQAFKQIHAGRHHLKYDQLILEFGRWVHISYAPVNPRKQALIARKVTSRSMLGRTVVKTVYDSFVS